MRLVQASVQCVLPDLYLQLMGKDLPHSYRTGSFYEAGYRWLYSVYSLTSICS